MLVRSMPGRRPLPSRGCASFAGPRAGMVSTAFLLGLAVLLTSGCSSRPRYRTEPTSSGETTYENGSESEEKAGKTRARTKVSTRCAFQVGMSSYYAHKFHGRPTASGEIFDMNGISAAHRELPLGTVIRVTHLDNGRSIVLKVNDRGPFIKGRILDLSLGAARKLDMLEQGVARVRIDIVEGVE